MDHGTQDDLTALLDAARAGGEDAKDRLVRAVYGELRRMTIRCLMTIRCQSFMPPCGTRNDENGAGLW